MDGSELTRSTSLDGTNEKGSSSDEVEEAGHGDESMGEMELEVVLLYWFAYRAYVISIRTPYALAI